MALIFAINPDGTPAALNVQTGYVLKVAEQVISYTPTVKELEKFSKEDLGKIWQRIETTKPGDRMARRDMATHLIKHWPKVLTEQKLPAAEKIKEQTNEELYRACLKLGIEKTVNGQPLSMRLTKKDELMATLAHAEMKAAAAAASAAAPASEVAAAAVSSASSVSVAVEEANDSDSDSVEDEEGDATFVAALMGKPITIYYRSPEPGAWKQELLHQHAVHRHCDDAPEEACSKRRG